MKSVKHKIWWMNIVHILLKTVSQMIWFKQYRGTSSFNSRLKCLVTHVHENIYNKNIIHPNKLWWCWINLVRKKKTSHNYINQNITNPSQTISNSPESSKIPKIKWKRLCETLKYMPWLRVVMPTTTNDVTLVYGGGIFMRNVKGNPLYYDMIISIWMDFIVLFM